MDSPPQNESVPVALSCERCRKSINERPYLLLECLHVICSICFNDLYKDLPDSQHLCSRCSQSSAVQKVQDHVFASAALVEKLARDDRLPCNNLGAETSHGVASRWCEECHCFLCEECVNAHQFLKSTSGHHMLLKAESLQGIRRHLSFRCSPHNEFKILFCKTCEKLTCATCQLMLHRSHDFVFVSEIATPERQKLQTGLDNLRTKIAKKKRIRSRVNEEIKSVGVLKEQSIATIRSNAENLIAEIRRRERIYIEEVSNFLNPMLIQKTKLKDEITKQLSLVDHYDKTVQNALNKSSDQELVSSLSAITKVETMVMNLQTQFSTTHVRVQVPALPSDLSKEDILRFPTVQLIDPKMINCGSVASTLQSSTPSTPDMAIRDMRQSSVVPKTPESGSVEVQAAQLRTSTLAPIVPSAVPMISEMPSTSIIASSPVRQWTVSDLRNAFLERRKSQPRTIKILSKSVINRTAAQKPSMKTPSAPVVNEIIQPKSAENSKVNSFSEKNVLWHTPQPQLLPLTSIIGIAPEPREKNTLCSPSNSTSDMLEEFELSVLQAAAPNDPCALYALRQVVPPNTSQNGIECSPIKSAQSITPNGSQILESGESHIKKELIKFKNSLMSPTAEKEAKNDPPNPIHSPQNAPLNTVQSLQNEKDYPIETNEDWCAVCIDGGNTLYCCDYCPKVFHGDCHIPATHPSDTEKDPWRCTLCRELPALEVDSTCEGSSLSTSARTICERILLELFCQYDSNTIFKGRAPQRRRYRNLITQEINLEVIKSKLAKLENTRRSARRSRYSSYSSIDEFIQDVELMFSNALESYPENTQEYRDTVSLQEFFHELVKRYLPGRLGVTPTKRLSQTSICNDDISPSKKDCKRKN